MPRRGPDTRSSRSSGIWSATRPRRFSAPRPAANSQQSLGRRRPAGRAEAPAAAAGPGSGARAALWTTASCAGCRGTPGSGAPGRRTGRAEAGLKTTSFCGTRGARGSGGAPNAGSGWRRARDATRCCAGAGPPSAGGAVATSTATRAAPACGTWRRFPTRRKTRWVLARAKWDVQAAGGVAAVPSAAIHPPSASSLPLPSFFSLPACPPLAWIGGGRQHCRFDRCGRPWVV